jgi:Protein of unknown function (DUF3054).
MNKRILILGDILTIALVTFIGFATHGEAGLSFLPRMAAAFLPLVAGWFLLAPWFGLFQDEIIHHARQLWRPVLTALFAAPLATVLRGLILNAPIIPVFAVVLGVTSAVGMVIWRAIWSWIANRRL